ncbi:MAG: pyrroline-5-carboxylate reductase [Thermoproteota archaeon]|nr:pyrroline-5-carboxylate reductase [Thermoproteota archaeon]
MGEALISGLIKSKLADENSLKASDAVSQRREYISRKYGISCLLDNRQVIENSDIVILAIQPRDMKVVLEGIRETITLNHILISIAAGISTEYISKILQKNVPIIRGMPNNPCMIGEGMIALAPTHNVTKESMDVARGIFNSIGRTIVIDEMYFDAITGLSGSGPAYVYLVIEALADGGVKAGIPKDVAIELAAQTVLGSARMVLETHEHPAKLKDMVATPGGTTISGLMELEEGKIRAAFMRAVEKATQRAKELTRE